MSSLEQNNSGLLLPSLRLHFHRGHDIGQQDKPQRGPFHPFKQPSSPTLPVIINTNKSTDAEQQTQSRSLLWTLPVKKIMTSSAHCIFQLRDFLDSFDGVLYWAHAKRADYKSNYSSFGYFLDAVNDTFGGVVITIAWYFTSIFHRVSSSLND
jgi:hypothetical protein